MARKQTPAWSFSVQEAAEQLGQLGITPGDRVMVHASLRAIGPVERGGEGLIEALDQAVGPLGTLVMVLGARDDWAWVNEKAEHERAALLRDAPPFDAGNTPAHPDIGVLAELFRRYPGTCVSDHPEGRIAARGHNAAEILADQPWHDYYGPGSPLERLVRHNGKILRLGADLDTATILHYAEYLVPLPAKRRVCRHRMIATADGPRIVKIACLDDENGIVQRDGEDYFATILRSFIEGRNTTIGVVGNASSELIDAADLVDYAVNWMVDNLS